MNSPELLRRFLCVHLGIRVGIPEPLAGIPAALPTYGRRKVGRKYEGSLCY